MVTQSRIKQVG